MSGLKNLRFMNLSMNAATVDVSSESEGGYSTSAHSVLASFGRLRKIQSIHRKVDFIDGMLHVDDTDISAIRRGNRPRKAAINVIDPMESQSKFVERYRDVRRRRAVPLEGEIETIPAPPPHNPPSFKSVYGNPVYKLRKAPSVVERGLRSNRGPDKNLIYHYMNLSKDEALRSCRV